MRIKLGVGATAIISNEVTFHFFSKSDEIETQKYLFKYLLLIKCLNSKPHFLSTIMTKVLYKLLKLNQYFSMIKSFETTFRNNKIGMA